MADPADRAAIVGAGHTRFGALREGPRELLRQAVDLAEASVDRGWGRDPPDAAFLATLGFGGWQLGNASALLAEEAHRVGCPVIRVENACASGGSALEAGVRAIESGRADRVLVAGLEKMTDLPSARRRYWLGVSGDTEWERLAGLTFAGVYALLASAHRSAFGTPPEALAEVAVKNHRNGLRNPNAHFRREITRDQVLAAPRVADPLGLYDCCPVRDGAAALLLVRSSEARRYTDTPVLVAGLGSASDYLAVQERPLRTGLAATRQAARQAFRHAPFDRDGLSFVEVHDCFTIAELLALEDLGLAPPGGAAEMTLAGATARTGALPVNPDGGLKSKGHPIGATGVSQVYEVFRQLRGDAGERQVPGAARALTHNVGGSGASAVVALFEAA